MITYKQISSTALNGSLVIDNAIFRSDGACIPFDPANTDYQAFKAEINADEAQLEDADGNLMTAEQAKDFVKELP